MVNLLIARHGNTFDKDDVIRRVGRGTDLPLSESGQRQAVLLGEYLKQFHPEISAVYTSTLKRTIQTATIALAVMHSTLHVTQSDIFDEIDYGPDEGKPETEVVARLGETALQQWDQACVVPEGWKVDPKAITENWENFATDIQHKYANKTVLVITSNGIARFAPKHKVKLSTGAVSLVTIENNSWHAQFTNRKPSEKLKYQTHDLDRLL